MTACHIYVTHGGPQIPILFQIKKSEGFVSDISVNVLVLKPKSPFVVSFCANHSPALAAGLTLPRTVRPPHSLDKITTVLYVR